MIRQCRFCKSALTIPFADLGDCPLANNLISESNIGETLTQYPLSVCVCEKCYLAQQTTEISAITLFEEYNYCSSYSDSWLTHCRKYVEMVIRRFHLSELSQIIEIASNDGYLLQYFIDKGFSTLGIEPAKNIAKLAVDRNIPTINEFFGTECAQKLSTNKASLLIANNVLAHVPDINDFVAGLKIILSPCGIATIEVPHLLQLIRNTAYDTIYHEHFYYFSVLALKQIFGRHGLMIFDIDELETHGGSIRLYLTHIDNQDYPPAPIIDQIITEEISAGLDNQQHLAEFQKKINDSKSSIINLLDELKKSGKSIAAYGAPAKGNTLLNTCGIGRDAIAYTVDRNPLKQGKLLPGSAIPIHHPDKIFQTKPNYIFILPWNIRTEIAASLDKARSWGCQFITAMPKLEVWS